MARITFRFYGRFVFAQSMENDGSTSGLYALAVNMQYNGDIKSDKHAFAMALQRGKFEPALTRPPDFMLGEDELAVWDLQDLSIEIPATQPLRWVDRARPFDLSALSDGGTLETRNLSTSGVYAPVNGVVHVSGGAARAYALKAGRVKLGKVDGTATSRTVADVDVVEIEIRVPDDQHYCFMMPLAHRAGGPVGSLAIRSPGPKRTTIVRFSNLCACPLRPAGYDTEFAAMYEVLQLPPLVRQRRVPSTRGSEFDCFKPAYITFQALPDGSGRNAWATSRSSSSARK